MGYNVVTVWVTGRDTVATVWIMIRLLLLSEGFRQGCQVYVRSMSGLGVGTGSRLIDVHLPWGGQVYVRAGGRDRA